MINVSENMQLQFDAVHEKVVNSLRNVNALIPLLLKAITMWLLHKQEKVHFNQSRTM